VEKNNTNYFFLKKEPKILIIGSDSVIGSALCNYFRKQGVLYYSTTRKNVSKENEYTIYIDLNDPIDNWVFPIKEWDWIIFCAAITSVKACEENPVFTRSINVDKTIALIHLLQQPCSKIIFFSTSLVFNGDTLFPNTQARTNPCTEYGRQKLEVENYLLNTIKCRSIVLRLSKVIYPDFPLFSKWISDLNEGKSIKPFKDLFIAPVFVDRVIELVYQMMKFGITGLFHFSGESLISYAEIAYLISEIKLFNKSLLLPIEKPLPNIQSNNVGLKNSPICKPYSEYYYSGISRLISAYLYN
jgi:dTDP-4-dehydrorhamnose reductase